jgi:hypothetical protein
VIKTGDVDLEQASGMGGPLDAHRSAVAGAVKGRFAIQLVR